MISIGLLVLLTSCSSPPTGPGGSAQVASEPAITVSPTGVWLSIGETAQLSARLATGEVSDDNENVTFTWTSSDPAVVEVSTGGQLRGVGRGTATISVSADEPGNNGGQYRKESASFVTVTTEEQEALVYKLLSLPATAAEAWPGLAFTSQYDAIFTEYGDHHWASSGGIWEKTYYDRGLAWYAAWARTGNAEYLQRGHTDVTAYRDEYVLPNDGAATPRWIFPEGLAIHYVLTGDTLSALAIAKMADTMVRVGWMDTMTDPDLPWKDGRIQGRSVFLQLIAYLIDAPELRDWKYEMERGVQALLDWHEWSGGEGAWNMSTYCGGQAHFMVSHAILEVLIRYYDLVEPREDIPPVIRKSLDYMWQYWDPEARALDYMTEVCPSEGTTDPAPDLDLLIVWPWGWYYQFSGEELYRIQGDEIFMGGLAGAWFSGTKQFNQSFMRSYRYPFYRR